MQPKAYQQWSKVQFGDCRWIGPYVVDEVFPNEKYIVRKINTNKTQNLHRIRLRKYTTNTSLEDS